LETLTTMKPRSVKAKGRALQNCLRDKLREAFPGLHEDDIKSQTMGMTGEDIILTPAARKLIPYSFECKNQERIQMWKFLEQAESNAGEHTPILVVKKNRTKPYVVLDLDKWIELIK